MQYKSLTRKRLSKSEPIGFGKFAEFSLEDLEYYHERDKTISTPFSKMLSSYLTWLKDEGII